jgi:hypothetical protein
MTESDSARPTDDWPGLPEGMVDRALATYRKYRTPVPHTDRAMVSFVLLAALRGDSGAEAALDSDPPPRSAGGSIFDGVKDPPPPSAGEVIAEARALLAGKDAIIAATRESGGAIFETARAPAWQMQRLLEAPCTRRESMGACILASVMDTTFGDALARLREHKDLAAPWLRAATHAIEHQPYLDQITADTAGRLYHFLGAEADAVAEGVA